MQVRNDNNPRRAAAGFTLIELLVVVAIIVVVVSISLAFLQGMRRGAGTAAGRDTISMAVDVTRAWSTRYQADYEGVAAGVRYRGTAAIFTPAGKVRIVKHDPLGEDKDGDLLSDRSLRGYHDVEKLDYVDIPSGVGVAGIQRNSSESEVEFIAPPFAITFNEDGQLITRIEDKTTDERQDVVYYDNAYNSSDAYPVIINDVYDTRDRDSYQPAEWVNPNAEPDGDPVWDDNVDRRRLPFEAIETVPGLVLYNKNRFETATDSNAEGGWPDGGVIAESDWPTENPDGSGPLLGEPMFFSPHTGVTLRE